MNSIKIFLVFIFVCGLLFCPKDSFVYGQKIRVAVSANASFVTQALKKDFERKNKAKIELIVSSSGKLTAQISHGAPYDIFLSADMKYPDNLYNAGYSLNKTRVYAIGSLVLWTLKNNKIDKGLESLKSASIKTIAVANPATAPYGAAAIRTLKKLGIYAAIKNKIVYGESISQVNQYLLSGVADVAFTAKSVIKSPNLNGKGKWIEVAADLYSPIRQGAVILKHASENNPGGVSAFYKYLFSTEGKSIFKSYGYIVP